MKFTRRAVVAGLALLLLAACGRNEAQQDAAAGAGAAVGQVVLNRGNGGEPKSLDPHHIQTVWENNIANDLFTGLLSAGPDATAVAGVAERWEISEDGLTWTFHLRDTQWSDGRPVTAEDFAFAWRRILDPKTASEYAAMLYDIRNGAKIAAGEMPPEMLGVSAPDARTVVVQLEHPAPYLPELMAHHTLFPVPRHVVEAKGNAWVRIENFVGNGAYVPREWVPNDHITLVKNPRFFDASNVKIDVVNYYPTVDYDAAIRRMRAGELDLVNQFSAQQIDWLRANMPETIKQVPSLTVYFLAMNQEKKPFDDIRVRQAINLAFNREAVVNDIRRMGEPPAYGLVPPGVANYPGGAELDFRSMPYAQRVERARVLMREAGFGPERRLKTSYTTTSSTDNRRLAPAIQQMLRAIYIDVEIIHLDPQESYDRLHRKDFELGYGGWAADYNDAYNFLGILALSNSAMNYQGYSNPKFDALIERAQGQRDAAERGRLLAEAEALLLADHAFVPYRFSATPNLVQPYVKGWTPNSRDLNATRWLSVERAAR